MRQPIHVQVDSEFGKLEAVIIHRPGVEVENMAPENVEKALYSDILNLTVAKREYDELSHILGLFGETLEIETLLGEILAIDPFKEQILQELCEGSTELLQRLLDIPPALLSSSLIEGIELERNTLTRFLSEEIYSLKPLHNFLFARDAAMVLGNQVLMGEMAGRIRRRESRIMAAIFKYHPHLRSANPIVPSAAERPNITIEGGDVLVAAKNTLIIGTGARTTPQGIDFIARTWSASKTKEAHILVQELPKTPESFIHLDMVFTLLGPHHAVVYEPVILKNNKLAPIHITLNSGRVTSIKEEKNLIHSLSALGMDIVPILCGGPQERNQKREQWHSGANFFALEPGKVVGYGRNEHTLEAMSRAGFEIINAKDVISKQVDPSQYKHCVITIAGAELARGGGGCRCLTMPIARRPLD